MRITISQLKALDAVARTKSFSAAARELGVTQPAVSRQSRELEATYGAKLFFRRGKRLELTELAHSLARKARVCLTYISEMESALSNEGDLISGTFTIGLSCHYLVMELLAVFMKRYPGVAVASSIGDSRKLIEQVLDGNLDIAAITAIEPIPNIASYHYSQQRIVSVVNHEHPWARLTSVDINLLENEPMVARPKSSGTRCIFEQQLSKANTHPHVVLELNSLNAMLEAVAAGIGFAIVLEDEFVGNEQLCCVPFVDDAEMVANQYFIYLPESSNLSSVSFFLKLAAEAKGGKRFGKKMELI